MKNGRDLDAPIQSIVQDLHHHTPCYTHMEMVNPVIRTDDLTENTQFRPVESKYGRTLEFIFTYDNKPSDDLEHCGYPGPSERRIPHATTEPLSDLSPAPFNNEADPPHNSALVDENEAPQAQTTVPQRKGKRKAVSQLSASASRHTKQTRTTTATARVNPQVRRAPMPTRSSTTRLQSGSDPIDDLTNTVQSTTIHDPTDDPPVNQTRDQAQRERPTAVPQRPRLSQLRYEARLAAIKRKEAAASAEKWAATSESWDATVEMYRQDIKMLEVKRAMAEYPAEE
ncbi:hypothetical protein BU16DRAFT_530251 [Lophium mytilinum]|uniref:Uncharacterized protein n=1 Tax=Lophium mytilinum TaxID=390894 RepID=A0A6A6QHX8_9PEZI|nr:hypothetical protein BU16DRAFT_530251 [Lophium mytilinum]